MRGNVSRPLFVKLTDRSMSSTYAPQRVSVYPTLPRRTPSLLWLGQGLLAPSATYGIGSWSFMGGEARQPWVLHHSHGQTFSHGSHAHGVNPSRGNSPC